MAERVLVGMSGGVDSAMSAYLLKESGFLPEGVNCRFFDKGEETANDIADAKSVADRLGIPFHVFDLRGEFKADVIDSFCSSYKSGGTPNPCVECNRRLKFGKMLDSALENGFDYIATGHYAQIEPDRESGRYLLKKGADKNKDQSYVLYMLSQFQLSHTLFPLGGLFKSEISQKAQALGFASAHRKESQDICFVPGGDYAGFIEEYTATRFPHGSFVDENGRVLGKHKGIIRYTVGQRRGLGLALPAPLYVKEKDAENNRVVLSPESSLFSSSLTAENINLIAFDRLDSPLRCTAKVRYRGAEQPATVRQTDENHFHIEFDTPQRAITKGQSVVLYDGEYVLGGGIIK